MASKLGSCAWALAFRPGDPELEWLSREGRNGLVWARQLAENARERSCAALTNDVLPVRLTVAGLARDELFYSARQIRAAIEQAKLELFGRPLSERALRHRLTKRASGQARWDPRRTCQEPGCTRQITGGSAPHKRYCDRHETPRARVRRHRQNKQTPDARALGRKPGRARATAT